MRSLIIPFFFLVMPLAEIATFVVVGREVGVWTTLFLVLLSAIVGAVLLRVQGLGVLRRIQDAARRGEDPGRNLVHAVMIVIAAFLLILPGFLSDALGLLLFIPAVREAGWRLIRNRLTIVTTRAGAGFYRGPAGPSASSRTDKPTVIDLDDDEFSHDDKSPRPPARGPDRLA